MLRELHNIAQAGAPEFGCRVGVLAAHDGRLKGFDVGIHDQRSDRGVCSQAAEASRMLGAGDPDAVPKVGVVEGEILHPHGR